MREDHGSLESAERWRRAFQERQGAPSATEGNGEATESLRDWWVRQNEHALAATVPKIQEYGTHDLTEIGRSMGRLMGWTDLTDAEAGEVGIWFYLQGKVARAFEALGRHELPSDDTVFDTKIYATMIEAYRQRGGLR